MDGDRELALLIRLGIPRNMSYEGLKYKPFWRTRERIAMHLLESDLVLEAKKGVLSLTAPRQGSYSSAELTKSMFKAAQGAATDYLQRLLPWMDIGKDDEGELPEDAEDRIEAWIARFEPENLEAYREERRRMAEAG